MTLRKSICSLMALTLSASMAAAAPSDIEWTDDVANNPVTGNPGFGDGRTYYAHVVWDEESNVWHAWYDASSGFDVGYAVSNGPDGIEFGDYQPVTGFTTDVQSKPFVLKTGPSEFRMWYMANEREGGYHIYTAVSIDGVNWTDDQMVSGIAYDPDGSPQFGPVERIAVEQLPNGDFVAYCRCEEFFLDEADEFFDQGKKLFRYVSEDGINWTWTGYTGVNEIEELGGMEFSSVIQHPAYEDVWYAWGNNANSSGPFYSFVSNDGGLTFELDEAPVLGVGEIGTQSYNADRNYHPSVTYMGDGQWVMFRTVAEPKRTARATGVEDVPTTSVADWSVF